jgi:hypothetical protein
VLLERLGLLKNPIVSSEIKPATFRLVARILNQLCVACPILTYLSDYPGGLRNSGLEFIMSSVTFQYYLELKLIVGHLSALVYPTCQFL